MFNLNIFKRRVYMHFYKYFICMCFLLSGVFIASYVYNTDFSCIKSDGGYVLNALIKVVLTILLVKYVCAGILRFVTAPLLLIYSGICLGTFLMFTLYTLPLYKFLLTIFPCAFKVIGVMLLFSSCFDFDKFNRNDASLYLGTILCFSGDVILCLTV